MTRPYVLLPVKGMDYIHANANPWGLTAHECCAMRLFCKYGNAKQVWAKEDVSVKTVQWHIEKARAKVGVPGHDVRLFLVWHRWFMDFNSEHVRNMRLARYKIRK